MWQRGWAYLRHVLTARGPHRVHSPFVFEFVQSVLPPQRSEAGEQIEALRKRLLKDHTRLPLQDYGAGSRVASQGQSATVAQLIRRAARRRRSGELLFRICRRYQPRRMLEMGTHLGIGTLYQAMGQPEARFISLEGSPAVAARAQAHLQEMGVSAEILVGEFSLTLQEQLDLSEYRPDYVLLDGNHRYAATVDYVKMLLPHMPPGGIIVLDDIYWSAGMQRAWEEIITFPEITVSLDLFALGICFVNRPQAKEHFRLRGLVG